MVIIHIPVQPKFDGYYTRHTHGNKFMGKRIKFKNSVPLCLQLGALDHNGILMCNIIICSHVVGMY